jgi:MFS family permease
LCCSASYQGKFRHLEKGYGFIVGQRDPGRAVAHRDAAVGSPSCAACNHASALLYAIAMGMFGGQAIAAFLAGMVILTLGELLIVPTITALVANIAPPDMRARYMGTFSLSFRIGAGIGPVIGGVLSDRITPAATWYGGMVVCVLAAAGFWILREKLAPDNAAAYRLARSES